MERYEDHRRRVAAGMLDHSFHQISSDPTNAVLGEAVPWLISEGVRSIKVFLTYEPLRFSDTEFLRVLATARRHGCLVAVHCENDAAIEWRTEALLCALG